MKEKLLRSLAVALTICMFLTCCTMSADAAKGSTNSKQRDYDWDDEDYDYDYDDDYDDLDDYDLDDDDYDLDDDDYDLDDDDSYEYSSDKYSSSYKSLSRIGKKKKSVSIRYYYTLKCKGYIYTAKSSNSKVVSIYSKDKGNGKLVINPKRYGKATITVKNKFGKKVQWAISVNKGSEFTILTGGKGFDMKRFIKHIPGWGKGKWTSKKASVVTVRGRRCHGYRGGTTTITLKAKSVTYKFKVHVRNRAQFYNKAKATLKNNLLVPTAMRVNSISNVGWTDDGGNAGVTISYSSLNAFGVRVYGQFTAWYTWNNKYKWKFPD